jgi:hypothetical protein
LQRAKVFDPAGVGAPRSRAAALRFGVTDVAFRHVNGVGLQNQLDFGAQ